MKKKSQNLKNFKKLVSDEVSPAMKDFIKEQETLEEVAEKLTNDFPALEVRFNMTNEEIYSYFLEALQKGAKWQQERIYSEEDMLKSFIAGIKCESNNGKNFEQFIKQFNNK